MKLEIKNISRHQIIFLFSFFLISSVFLAFFLKNDGHYYARYIILFPENPADSVAGTVKITKSTNELFQQLRDSFSSIQIIENKDNILLFSLVVWNTKRLNINSSDEFNETAYIRFDSDFPKVFLSSNSFYINSDNTETTLDIYLTILINELDKWKRGHPSKAGGQDTKFPQTR